jgi:geranylgeranyl diphosphate synthase type II
LNDYFEKRRELVEARLQSLVDESTAPNVLKDPLSRAILSRGKRVRALLTIAVGEAVGLKADRLVDAATAFELIHACSLVLDDLPAMDDAELRRGEPALHRAFGEDLAILSAVALLNRAYGLLASNHSVAAPRRWPLAVVIDRVVSAVGWDGTIGGEAVDLHSEGRSLDFQTLEYIHSRKTGALFVAAAAVGAMLANATEGLISAVEAYAKNLGLAFQITDDILDVTSDRETLGKDIGKDEGKLTFVRLAGLDGARQLSHELVDTSLVSIASLGAAGRRLRELAELVRDRSR